MKKCIITARSISLKNIMPGTLVYLIFEGSTNKPVWVIEKHRAEKYSTKKTAEQVARLCEFIVSVESVIAVPTDYYISSK